MRKWLGLGLAIGAGLAGTARGQDLARFDGQYVGELTLTRELRGDCTRPPLGALYKLTIAGGEVRFAYLPRFDTTLKGRIDGKGVFRASARLKKGTIQMTGKTDGYHLSAQIASPSCHYEFRVRN
jgi:hypothetical protein